MAASASMKPSDRDITCARCADRSRLVTFFERVLASLVLHEMRLLFRRDLDLFSGAAGGTVSFHCCSIEPAGYLLTRFMGHPQCRSRVTWSNTERVPTIACPEMLPKHARNEIRHATRFARISANTALPARVASDMVS